MHTRAHKHLNITFLKKKERMEKIHKNAILNEFYASNSTKSAPHPKHVCVCSCAMCSLLPPSNNGVLRAHRRRKTPMCSGYNRIIGVDILLEKYLVYMHVWGQTERHAMHANMCVCVVYINKKLRFLAKKKTKPKIHVHRNRISCTFFVCCCLSGVDVRVLTVVSSGEAHTIRQKRKPVRIKADEWNIIVYRKKHAYTYIDRNYLGFIIQFHKICTGEYIRKEPTLHIHSANKYIFTHTTVTFKY